MKEINRIIIAETDGKNMMVGDLKKCPICKINFSAKGNCIMCDMRIEKEKEVGRKLNEEEWNELYGWIR